LLDFFFSPGKKISTFPPNPPTRHIFITKEVLKQIQFYIINISSLFVQIAIKGKQKTFVLFIFDNTPNQGHF